MEIVLERNGDDSAFVDQKGGGPVRQARLGITLDGYSAPLTAGNMAANFQDGIYNGTKLNASYASVLAGAGTLPGDACPSPCSDNAFWPDPLRCTSVLGQRCAVFSLGSV